MNRCDISEEETTKALHSLYQLPLPENQNGTQYPTEKTTHGVNSVDQSNLNYQGNSLDMADGRKKHYKLNETSSKGIKAGLTQTPVAKKFHQNVLKKGTLDDKKQPSPGVNQANKSSGQHLSKSENVLEMHSHRQKQEHVPGGLSFFFALNVNFNSEFFFMYITSFQAMLIQREKSRENLMNLVLELQKSSKLMVLLI